MTFCTGDLEMTLTRNDPHAKVYSLILPVFVREAPLFRRTIGIFGNPNLIFSSLNYFFKFLVQNCTYYFTVPFSSAQITRKSQNDDETTMVASADGHCCVNYLLFLGRLRESVKTYSLKRFSKRPGNNKELKEENFSAVPVVEPSKRRLVASANSHCCVNYLFQPCRFG